MALGATLGIIIRDLLIAETQTRWFGDRFLAFFGFCLVLAIMLPVTARAEWQPCARSGSHALFLCRAGADTRRSQLHRVYCEAALDRAIWAARRGHWLDNPRCW